MAQSKYRNKRVGEFDSKKEWRRSNELALLEQAGAISGVVHHPRFRIEICGIHVCDYEADFRYTENGKLVIEDVKGVRTDVYRIKKKLMKAVHGIEIVET